MKRTLIYTIVFVSSLLSSVVSHAEEYVITLKNKNFSPNDLSIPAGHKVKITVKNQDKFPAEFESSDLNREKVLPARRAVTLYIGPLEIGSYSYCDDFHCDRTKGLITSK